MDDDTSSSQPIADLKQTMAMDLASHSDGQMTPETLASQQKNDLKNNDKNCRVSSLAFCIVRTRIYDT